jgi:hypothetical protein
VATPTARMPCLAMSQGVLPIDLSRLQDTARTRVLRLTSKLLNLLAHPTRFERVAFAFGGQRSMPPIVEQLFSPNAVSTGRLQLTLPADKKTGLLQ